MYQAAVLGPIYTRLYKALFIHSRHQLNTHKFVIGPLIKYKYIFMCIVNYIYIYIYTIKKNKCCNERVKCNRWGRNPDNWSQGKPHTDIWAGIKSESRPSRPTEEEGHPTRVNRVWKALKLKAWHAHWAAPGGRAGWEKRGGAAVPWVSCQWMASCPMGVLRPDLGLNR